MAVLYHRSLKRFHIFDPSKKHSGGDAGKFPCFYFAETA